MTFIGKYKQTGLTCWHQYKNRSIPEVWTEASTRSKSMSADLTCALNSHSETNEDKDCGCVKPNSDLAPKLATTDHTLMWCWVTVRTHLIVIPHDRREGSSHRIVRLSLPIVISCHIDVLCEHDTMLQKNPLQNSTNCCRSPQRQFQLTILPTSLRILSSSAVLNHPSL